MFLTRWGDAKYVYTNIHQYTSIHIHIIHPYTSIHLLISTVQTSQAQQVKALEVYFQPPGRFAQTKVLWWDGGDGYPPGWEITSPILGKKEHHLQKCSPGRGDMFVPFSSQEGNTVTIASHLPRRWWWPVGPSPNQSSSRPWQNHTMTGTKMVCPLGNQFEITQLFLALVGWAPGTRHKGQFLYGKRHAWS